MQARARLSRDRCLHVSDEKREPLLLPSGRMHPSPSSRGAASASDHHPRRPGLGSSVDSGSSPASHRFSSQIAQRSDYSKLRFSELGSNLFQDIRLVAEDLGLQTGYVESILAVKKPAFSSRWSKYKRWCLEVLHHPFGASFRSQINYETVLAQVMEYLSYFKTSCTSFSSFSDTKTMLAWVYKSVFAYQFGTDVRIMQWMKGWQHEKPKSVKFDTDTHGWDVGLIVDY